MYKVGKLSLWETIKPHVLVILFFLGLSVAYFSPLLKNQEIRQGDVEKFIGMSQELRNYYNEEGGSSAWTGAMFSGMPAYTIGIYGGVANALDYIEKPFKALGGKDIGVVFVSMLTCYILLLILGANCPVAAMGAIAFAFSSYSIIILEAGHITKAWAMAYIPLIVSGFVLVLRKMYLSGGALFAFALALQVKNNHVQITYYLALFCLIIYIGYAVQSLKNKCWKNIVMSFSTLLVAVIIAVLCNLSGLYSNYESAEQSIRGKSELSHSVDGKMDKSDGLDKDYAFAWSYGIGETFTILIPDFYGGSSGGFVGKDSQLAKEMGARGYQVPEKIQTYTYWGDQPFTSGPVYFGAIICFLFVISLFVVRNPLKWWIAGAIMFFILLSWGRNFDDFNTFLFHNLPFYNKFRTVSMALVIPQFAFAVLAAWGMIVIVREKIEWKEVRKPFRISLAITGGICLLFGLFLPFDFSSVADQRYGMPDWYLNALRADRESLMRMDAFRSLAFILIAAGCLYLYVKNKYSGTFKYAPWILTLLVLVDLWGVDKRYLNKEDFVPANSTRQIYQPSAADKIILNDPDLSYRVLSLNDPFNDSHTSYLHKSIGGYSAAKLRRYQELIDLKIMPEMQLIVNALKGGKVDEVQNVFKSTPVLNMLNMRYLIVDPAQYPVLNRHAFGNAWFVKDVKIVPDADAEMSALGNIDPYSTAVVDQRFADMVTEQSYDKDSLSSIRLIQYKPDRLRYEYESSEPGVIVFSEVYYPHGWKAFIDDKPVPHFRTNWILRGMKVPEGNHKIEFRFEPDEYNVSRWVAIISSLLLIVILAGLLLWRIVKKSKE